MKENTWLQNKKHLVRVMVYDLLFGKGIQGGGRTKKLLLKYKTSLEAALVRLKIKARVSDVHHLLPPQFRNRGILFLYCHFVC
jgi:putative methyltransferase